MLINTERIRDMADLELRKDTFQVLFCIEGCGTLFMGKETVVSYFAVDCIFILANCEDNIKVHGKSKMLKVSC